MPYEDWCDACKGVGYNDGCKQCDEDYDRTMFHFIENELACALADPEHRIERIIMAMRQVHEHALWGNYNKEFLEERVKCMLKGQNVKLDEKHIYGLDIKLED